MISKKKKVGEFQQRTGILKKKKNQMDIPEMKSAVTEHRKLP